MKSIGTNPGPVHSDRIYKTVYPKVAAEFLRIGGLKGLTNKQIEKNATVVLLPFLGDEQDIIENEVMKMGEKIVKKKNNDSNWGLKKYKEILLKTY